MHFNYLRVLFVGLDNITKTDGQILDIQGRFYVGAGGTCPPPPPPDSLVAPDSKAS